MKGLKSLLAYGILSAMMFVANIGIGPTCWGSFINLKYPKVSANNL
ncbi:hypothetical protein N752_25735 [Desulforamulus aquiferis]|nr:hypothetical protein N752_25735 [Desulforamulus aquiferis]